MSWEAVTWAVEIGQECDLDPTKRHILLIMGNRADETGYLFPSVGWICARTGHAERTVRQHLKELEQAGLIRRTKRATPEGGRTSDGIQMRLRQPGLDLPPPPAKSAGGGPARDAPPLPLDGGGPPAAGAPYSKEDSKKKKKPSAGGKPPTAVAQCWQAYAEGVKGRHGVEPCRNAKANGQLQQVVNRVGADAAVKMIAFYLAHPDPFYAQRHHSLDYLVRDCSTKFWIEMGKQAGGREAPAPTKAQVRFEYENGGQRTLDDYPLGTPIDIAKKCKQDYGRMVASTRPKTIVVQIGQASHRYSIAELDQGRTA